MSEIQIIDQRFIQFGLGEHAYVMPLLEVREVIPPPSTTPIPGAPDHYVGLANIRGQVISVIDLRKHIGITPRDQSQEVVLITNIDDFNIGLLIDSIDRVLSPEDIKVCEVDEYRSSTKDEFIDCVYKASEQLLFSIDIRKLLDISAIEDIEQGAVE